MATKKPDTYPRLEVRKVSSLKAHPDGVRYHAPDSSYHLGRSYERWGLVRPAFVLNAATGNLLDGDLLLGLLRDRGVEEVPVWVVSVPEEDEDAVHLALQNHAGEWQWQAVSVQLQALKDRKQDLGLTGFHESDTGPLTAADWSPPEKGPMDGADPGQKEMFG